MSDDTDLPSSETPNPLADYLIRTRELVASGSSVYGPVGSPKQVEKMAELEARLDLGRELGEIPAAPAPWADRVRQERLKQEFPFGDPAEAPVSELLANGISQGFQHLDELPPAELARRADLVASDFADRASRVSFAHSRFDPATGTKPGGYAIVEALVKVAEPAIQALGDADDHDAMRKLIRSDRQLLELFAARGQAMTAFAERKKQLKIGG